MTMLQTETTMARPNKPARAKKEAPTARPKTFAVRVSSPTVPGATEQLQRVGNPLESMRRRRQLDERCFRAAERIRIAHETVYGSVGGVMDYDRARGGGTAGSPPAPVYMEAAELLSEFKRVLYPSDYRVVSLVTIGGYRIDDVAQMIYGPTASRAAKEETGRALRTGLSVLADLWFGGDKSDRGIVGSHAPDAMDYKPSISGIIERGNVVHATGHRIFRK